MEHRDRYLELNLHPETEASVQPHIYVNHIYKYVYIPMGKIASTSVISALSDGELPHGKAKNTGKSSTGLLKIRRPKKLSHYYKDYFIFAFVRHPFDRLVSLYHNLLRNAKRQDYFRKKYGLAKKLSFSDYLLKILSSKHIDYHYELQYVHLVDSLVDLSNQPEVVNFIGYFENLEEDFNKIIQKIGLPYQKYYKLPKRGSSRPKKTTADYFDYFDPILASRAFIFYKKDFIRFGYKPSNTLFLNPEVHMVQDNLSQSKNKLKKYKNELTNF